MARIIKFYKTKTDKSPIEEFLNSLPAKVVQKITWVLSIIEDMEKIPEKYFKKLKSTELYECRIDFAGNTYRLLGFMGKGNFIVLTNGFMKKTQKTPKEEIELCESRMKEYSKRGETYE